MGGEGGAGLGNGGEGAGKAGILLMELGKGVTAGCPQVPHTARPGA